MWVQPVLFRNLTAVVVATVACLPQQTVAQSSESESQVGPNGAALQLAKNDYVLRTYEVSDLVVNIQDHPYSESLDRGLKSFGGTGAGGGGLGGGGGGGLFSVPNDEEGLGLHGAATNRANVGIKLCQFGGGGGGGRGGGGGGVGAANLPPATTSITIDDLKRVLVATVASDSWAINGGGEGQVEPLGTALVVSQTPAVHEEIQELLKQIRHGSGDRKTVTIDARWLFLNSNDLDRLVLPDQSGVPLVDRKVLDEFTRRSGSIRGIANCFSSQLVYLVSGTQQNFVSGYIPVVGSLENGDAAERLVSRRSQSLIRLASQTEAVSGERESRVGYQPIVEKPTIGVLLEIRPTLIRGDETAIVDLKSTLTAGKQPLQTEGSKPSPIAPEVDRIAIETQEFATTLRMPLGRPVLVGGLTNVPGSTESTEDGENSQLYFVLQVR